MSTQSATVIELRASDTDITPRLRIYVAADGDIVFQTLGTAGLRFISADGVTIEARTAATLTAPAGVSVVAPDGSVEVAAGVGINTTAGTGQNHHSGAGIAWHAGSDIEFSAINIHQRAGELHRTEATVIDLHASQKLREDANGVGHTYTGNEVHYWTPWCGTGNRPHPPEHPYEGTDDTDWPPIDMDAMAMPEGSC